MFVSIVLFQFAVLHSAVSLELAFGDFDLNGFDDLVIGCPVQSVVSEGQDLAEAGAVTVVFADANGLGVKSQLWHLGKPDIPGTPNGFDHFGGALAVGDFNGDGVVDLAVGSPKDDGDEGVKNTGAVTVVFGAPISGLRANANTPARRFTGRTFGNFVLKDQRFGSALVAGDFDQNGADDLAIGVPSHGFRGRGFVYVLYGPFPQTEPPVFQTWSQKGGHGDFEVQGEAEEDDRFGATLASGDFDGDGFGDLAVGVPGEDTGLFFEADAGAVNIIYGSRARLQESRNRIFHQNTDGVKEAGDRDDEFGFSLAVGNFNGDESDAGHAMDDLAIGVPSEDFQSENIALFKGDDRGKVQVLYGSNDGLTTTDQVWSKEGSEVARSPHEDEFFGFALAAADFDGDDRDDLAIGIPGEELTSFGDGDGRPGATLILFGSPDLLTADGNYYLNRFDEPPIAKDGDRYGMALAVGKAGNGSAPDLAIGVNDGTFGGAQVYYGTSSGPRVAGNEVVVCLEEALPNQPDDPGTPGSIPGGPGGQELLSVPFSPLTVLPLLADEAPEPLYSSPTGYLYQFEGEEFDEGWDHDNLSDAWDGLPIGQSLSMPGGVSFRELNDESFVRLQDPGDPRDHDFGDDPSNRKLTFSRDMQNEFAANDGLILDVGVTLHFRIRLSTGSTGPLDGVYPDGGVLLFQCR